MEEIWLTRREVQELLGVTQQAVNKRIQNGHFVIKEVNEKGKKYLIALSSLPDEAKERYFQRKKEKEKKMEVNEKVKRIALAKLDLIRMWKEYREGAKKKTEADKEFIKAYNSGKIAQRIYQILGKVSIRSLYRWHAELEGSEDYTRLIPQWNSGEKRETLTEIEKNIFMGFLLDPKKVSIGEAIRLTKYILQKRGITARSCSTYRRFAERFKQKHYDIWVLMREGQKALRDKVETFIRRDPSLLEPGEVLVADGHRLNFQVINPFTGKPCRPVMVAFIDWKGFTLVGYEIMLTENVQCIASALRNAIIRLGKIPKVIYVDNGKAFRAKYFTGVDDFNETGLYGLFARLGVTTIFAKPYNARAKVIERWFKEFTNTFERLMPSFVGSSILDKPAYLKRNEKFHTALHRQYIPTIEETIMLIEKWLSFEYSQPCPNVKGATKGEVLESGKGPGVNIDELDDLMMEAKIANITRNGIRFLNAEYWDEALYGYREQVIIKYSFFDLSYVKVYDKKGEFLCIARRREKVHPLAGIKGTAKDMEELKRQLAEQKRLEKRTIQIVKELGYLKKKVEVDWGNVIDITPRIVKKLEKEGVELPPIEERIPDEAVKRPSEKSENLENLENKERPFFGDNAIARYEWHLKYGFHTEEDWAFKEEFEKSLEYKMLQALYKQFEDEELKISQG